MASSSLAATEASLSIEHRPPVANYMYKIMPRSMLEEAKAKAAASGNNVFEGSDLDNKDGFIHLSQAHQVRGTLGRFFKGQKDLIVLKVSVEKIDSDEKMAAAKALRYEFGVPRPEGADHNNLYPHLFLPLPLDAIVDVIAVAEADGEEGGHSIPDLEA